MTIRAAWTTRASSLAVLCVLASCSDEGEDDARDPAVQAQLVPEAARIESVSMSGPGCEGAGPTAIGITGSRDSFRIQFDRFAVSASGPTSRETECTVSVVLDAPEGTKYAPAGLSIAGDTSSRATVSTQGFWASAPDHTSEDVTTFARSGSYLTGALDDAQLWSACTGTRELRFKVQLALGADHGSAQIERLQNLHFYARDCPRYLDAGSDVDAGTLDAGLDAGLDGGAPDADVAPADGGAPDRDPASPAVSIVDPRAAGAGCPSGTTTFHIPAGAGTFDAKFDRFALASTPEEPQGLGNCTLNLQVDVPAGKTVALQGLTLRGDASLPADTDARFFAYYTWAGAAGNSLRKAIALVGQHEGPFATRAEFVGEELVYRSCQSPGRRLNLLLGLSLTGSETSAAHARLGSVEGVTFAVRDCP